MPVRLWRRDGVFGAGRPRALLLFPFFSGDRRLVRDSGGSEATPVGGWGRPTPSRAHHLASARVDFLPVRLRRPSIGHSGGVRRPAPNNGIRMNARAWQPQLFISPGRWFESTQTVGSRSGPQPTAPSYRRGARILATTPKPPPSSSATTPLARSVAHSSGRRSGSRSARVAGERMLRSHQPVRDHATARPYTHPCVRP
jgi:hypothetical protein